MILGDGGRGHHEFGPLGQTIPGGSGVDIDAVCDQSLRHR